MRILFVTPSEVSSGEAITALHMARLLSARNHEARFISSEFTGRFLKTSQAGQVIPLTEDREHNRALFDQTLGEFVPDAICFADFALAFFSTGAPPLADEAWLFQLMQNGPRLLTLDHLGYGQGEMTLRFGSLDSYRDEVIQAPPPQIELMLPCPIQAPAPAPHQKGRSFRYWDAPAMTEAQRNEVRSRYLRGRDDLLVFHSVPTWAWQFARSLELPLYAFYTRLLEQHLRGLDRPVTVISVNSGSLLQPSDVSWLHVQNISAIPPADYERLILCADLMLTENCLSVTLGKAVCAGVPAVAFRNSVPREQFSNLETSMKSIIKEMEQLRLGAFYPFEVFPIWRREDVDTLGVLRDNPFTEGFAQLELFGESTPRAIQQLLKDNTHAAGQRRYRDAQAELPSAFELLETLL